MIPDPDVGNTCVWCSDPEVDRFLFNLKCAEIYGEIRTEELKVVGICSYSERRPHFSNQNLNFWVG